MHFCSALLQKHNSLPKEKSFASSDPFLYNYDTCSSSAGARCISDILMRIDSLQVLELGWNNIGDDGIAFIAEALNTSRISILDVCKCGITFIGAKALGLAIQLHHTIRKVLVRDNPITVEGANLILRAALDSKVCQYVSINDEYERNSDVKKWVASLEHRRKFEVCCMYACCLYYDCLYVGAKRIKG